MSLRSLILHANKNAKREFEQKLDPIRARTVGIDYTNSPEVANRPGYIWVIEYTLNGGYSQVFNAGVPNQINIPVFVSQHPKKPYIRQAHSIDWDNVKNVMWSNGGTNVGTIPHGRQHEWRDWDPGYDVVSVYPRNIVPLRSFPADGLNVFVDYCRYNYDRIVRQFEGVTFNWSAYANSGLSNTTFILVYLDMQTNSVKAVANTVPSSSVGAIPVEHYPALPDYALPSCIIMHNNQSTTTESMITDVRDLYVYEDSRVYDYIEALQADLYDVQADLYGLYDPPRWNIGYISGDVPDTLQLTDATYSQIVWDESYLVIEQDTRIAMNSDLYAYVVPVAGDYQSFVYVDLYDMTSPPSSSEVIKISLASYINDVISQSSWAKFDVLDGILLHLAHYHPNLAIGDTVKLYLRLDSLQSPLEFRYILRWTGFKVA